MEEKQETKKTIKISLKTDILIVVMVLAIIGLVAYVFIKDNKQENTNTNIVKENNIEKEEVQEKIELTEFTPKTFEQKYIELYSIVKGSEKVVNNITYSYRLEKVNNYIENATEKELKESDLETKLNIIANKIDVNGIQTVQDVKEIIKKYYGIEENVEFPERLDIITGTNQVTHFGKQDNNYQMQAKSVITNTDNYVLGILDNVEDAGDTVVIKEKVVFATVENDEITFESGAGDIAKNKKIEQFDIGKYYDKLGSYEYTFKKNGDNYNLVDIKFRSIIEEKSYAYKYFNEGLEIETLLPKNQILKVTSIEKNSEGKFIITGNVYEECIISKETLEELKNGKTINLYGREYKYDYKKGVKPKDNIVIDVDIEYEIEQLIPVDGEKGVYLIRSFDEYFEELFNKRKNDISLIFAPVEDWVERVGSQENIDTLLVEKKPIETISITVDNIGKYGYYEYRYYEDGEFFSNLEVNNIESIYNDRYSENNENYYNDFFNFIMKDGKAVEFWSNNIGWE